MLIAKRLLEACHIKKVFPRTSYCFHRRKVLWPPQRERKREGGRDREGERGRRIRKKKHLDLIDVFNPGESNLIWLAHTRILNCGVTWQI